jgi:molybdopterin-guanine dinucleotide biosynthesis protein A
MRVAAAIIAGGQGTRMGGQEKALLRVAGIPIVERQLAALRSVFDRIFIVSHDPALWTASGVPTVGDKRPGRLGPLAGIEAALEAIEPPYDAVVCVASDMPFLDPRALLLLRDHPAVEEVVVPVAGGRFEPLFARYRRSCLPAVRTQLDGGNRKLMDFLQVVSLAPIPETELLAIDSRLRFLVNVNTPEDLARLTEGSDSR